MATPFETSTRFSQIVTQTASATFDTNGLVLATGTTSGSDAYSRWRIGSFSVFLGLPVFSCIVKIDTIGATDDNFYFGLGDVGNPASFTTDHAGF
ncbi:MAG: hypothetical protein IIA03_11690, partial [Proteobacteria bacterium]|nr:hypothetical protein [Pseudomonadota bacterium]